MSSYNEMPQDANLEADSGECLARSAFRRAKRVYVKHKGASDRLLAQRSAFSAGSRQNDFFTRAVLECFACHFLHNPAYRRLCLHQSILPGDIRKYADLGCLPYITVKAENGHLQNILTTAAASSIKLYCRQNAADGQAADIPLDARSLRRLRRAADNMGRAYRLYSRENVNYLFLTPSAGSQPDAWGIWEQVQLTQLTKIRHIHTGSAFADGCAQVLERFRAEGSAWRIAGSPEQIIRLAESAPQLDAECLAARRSYAFACTSWEEYGSLPRREIAQALGIPSSNVRAVCTAPLQLLPFCGCEAGKLHVPVYARIIVRDPQTLQPQIPSRSGLLQFLSPCLSGCASFSVLTEYKGHLETDCPCGRRAPVLIVEE